MSPLKTFTTGLVAKILHVSSRQLTYWDARGLISNEASNSVGASKRLGSVGRPPGSRNRSYSVDEIVICAIIRDLCRERIPLARIRGVATMLRRQQDLFGSGGTLGEALLRVRMFLLISKNRIHIETESRAWDRVTEMMQDRGPVVILDLSTVAESAGKMRALLEGLSM